MAKSRRKAPRAAKPRAKRPAKVAPPVSQGLQPRPPRAPRDPNLPRPSWWRILHAYSSLIEEGKPVTEVAIAKEVTISRMSLYRLHRRNPRLRAWLNEQLCERNQELVGPVIHMLGTTALRTKSPEHAKLFLQASGSIGALAGEGGGGDAPPALGVQVVNNILVPRPELPQFPGAPPAPPAPSSAIPTVTVTSR